MSQQYEVRADPDGRRFLYAPGLLVFAENGHPIGCIQEGGRVLVQGMTNMDEGQFNRNRMLKSRFDPPPRG